MKPSEPNKSFFEQLKSHYQTRHAPPITRLAENESARLATTIVATISLLILLFVLWASLTRIEEIAVTSGEVIPKSKVYTVQNLEGGVIGNILVKEGDEVQAGQVLVIFDPTIPKLELEQIRARNAALIASTQYLQTLLTEGQKTEGQTTGDIPKNEMNANTQQDSQPNVSTNMNQITNDSTSPTSPSMDGSTKNATPSVQTTAPNGESITTVKSKALEDLSRFESVLEILKKRLSILIQEKDMYETLIKTGAVAKKDYLALLRTITQVQEDISKAQAARVETQYAISKLEDRINRIEVKSPIHGLVKGLQTHVGNVIQPGGVLMEIVPVEDLMVETKIKVSDIGHIKIGAPVKVKVDAYDYTRYGYITGKLVNISATTFFDDPNVIKGTQKAPYYKGLVDLDKSYLGDNPNHNRLLPGMTVQADINTGSKSLLQYLLRPVEVLISSSFREY